MRVMSADRAEAEEGRISAVSRGLKQPNKRGRNGADALMRSDQGKTTATVAVLINLQTENEDTMRKIALITLMAFAAPAFAADLTTDTMLGKTMDEVKTTLTDMGYEVRKAEMEDGNIEVYFVKDGKMGEVYVAPETGAITKLDWKN
tara:strand:- start:1308 stop:1748 length:441 start_codon:yes stop_codon:yes gene_type:complete